MKWQIDISKEADKFLKKNRMPDTKIISEIEKALLKLQGVDLNIDMKKMKGEWKDFFRLRIGRMRVVFKIDFDNRIIFVDRIDFRGDVYN